MAYSFNPKRTGWQTTSTNEIAEISARFGGGTAPKFTPTTPQNRFKAPITWRNVNDPANDRMQGGLPASNGLIPPENGLVAPGNDGDTGNQIAGMLARESQATPQPVARDSAMNAQQRWMEEGGTQRTWNKALVARGVRPQIDARSNPSPANSGSGASASIQAGWGWKNKGLPY